MAWKFLGPLLGGQRRKARKEAKRVLKDAQALMLRAKGRLPQEARLALHTAVAQLRDQLKQDDGPEAKATQAATLRLEQLAQRHLSVYARAGWLENLESMGYAVVVALVLRALVVEAFKIPSGSMIPTLAIGDQIFVNKYIFGPRVPFTNWRPFHFAAPKRGDVVVFVCPVEPHEDFIKRIVGLAGDVVMVRNGLVSINGVAMPRTPLGPTTHWDKDSAGVHWMAFHANAFAEKLGEHTFVALQDSEMAHRAPDFGPHVVPEGHVFMMGDNRDHSYDSRAWGPVPIDNILGRSMFVWWSWGQEGLRTSRLGTRLD